MEEVNGAARPYLDMSCWKVQALLRKSPLANISGGWIAEVRGKAKALEILASAPELPCQRKVLVCLLWSEWTADNRMAIPASYDCPPFRAWLTPTSAMDIHGVHASHEQPEGRRALSP